MIRRLFSKHTARILLWLLISVLTLAVLLHAWANWSGRRRWAAVKAMIEREGETLDHLKMLPETPPETQNLMAMAPLGGITEGTDEDAAGTPGAKRKALDAMKLPADAPPSKGVEMADTSEMQAWARFLREKKYLGLPAETPTPGKEVLVALDAKFPVLKQMADLAPQRTHAMFTPGLRERKLPEMLFSLPMRHYNSAQTLARTLCLRARAAIDARQGTEAAHSLLAAEMTGHACEAEPLLIGLLVGCSVETLANEGIWLGLRERVFNDGDLLLLQDTLRAHDLTQVLLQACRGEMAFGLNVMEYMQEVAAGRKAVAREIGTALSSEHPTLLLNVFRLLPGGLFDHWKSVIAEQEWKHMIEPLRSAGIAAAVKASAGINADIQAHASALRHPDYLMARMVIPALSSVSTTVLLVHAREQQALTAIALERFFLKHAKYPATLQELVPEFSQAVPRDPCDGQEMRYRPTAEGRYKLWCVGLDGRDDQGEIKKNNVPLKNADYLGDWTWQYEPVKTAAAGKTTPERSQTGRTQ